MIWVICLIIMWATLLFLLVPLVSKTNTSIEDNADIAAYSQEIDRISEEIAKNPNTELETRKITLQRKLLELTDKTQPTERPTSKGLICLVSAFFILGGFGLYSWLGSPELTKDGALQQEVRKIEKAPVPSDAALLTELERRLENESKNDPQGWLYYARLLLRLDRPQDAIAAYEKAAKLSDNHPRFVKEYEQARDYYANKPSGPTQDDIAAAAELEGAERQAMIESMVESLASKLKDNPDNPQGWVRLLRSRQVLDQTDLREADIEFLKEFYADKPQVIKDILKKSTPP